MHASAIAKIAATAAMWMSGVAWTVQAADLAAGRDGPLSRTELSRTEWLEAIFHSRAEPAAALPATLSRLQGAENLTAANICFTCAGGSRVSGYCNASIDCPGSYCNVPPFCHL